MNRPRTSARLVLAALIAIFATAVVTASPPAFAHAGLVGSTPADGSTLDSAPASVVLEFDSALLDVGAVAVVTGADGQRVSHGQATVTDRRLIVETDPTAPPGTYTVAFRVISKDGHTVTSLVHYTVAGAAPSTSTATATPADVQPSPAVAASTTATGAAGSTGHSPLVWLVAGLLLLVIVVVSAALLKR